MLRKKTAKPDVTPPPAADPSSDEKDAQSGDLFPMAVFLDTNILDSLPESLESGELSSLVSQVRVVLLPDIVAREWVNHRCEKAKESLKSAEVARRHLGQYSEQWVDVRLKAIDELDREVMKASVRRLRAAGLRVLGRPGLNSREVTLRAVLKVPPFKIANRGFKDEVILLSMLRHLAKWTYKSALLVTQDTDFSEEVCPRFEEIGVKLLFARSLAKAADIVDRFLGEADKATMATRNAAVVALVEQHWEIVRKRIEDTAKREGVPELALRGLFSQRLPEGGSIKKLLSVTPRDIESVTVGGRPPTTGRTLITVWVVCDVTFELEVTNWISPLFRNVTMEEKRALESFPKSERKIIKAECSLSVEATAVEHEDETWSDFQIIEDKGEYYRMLRETETGARAAGTIDL